MMKINISSGIRVQVIPSFRPDYSNLSNAVYFFDYSIEIENQRNSEIQLLSRKWKVFDSMHAARIFEGIGVVGETPVIAEGGVYAYSSGCDLNSELGYMEGMYTFKDLITNEIIDVLIPKFELFYPYRFN
ncbi:MAG: Co2+/Mg2+ efflux protein ApaG [Crocinitomicaceae bacterium]